MSINTRLDSTQKVDLSNYIIDRLSRTDSSCITRTVSDIDNGNLKNYE